MNKIKEIADCLLNGGVALVPTDTVYGLAAIPSIDKAVEKIYDLKMRPRNMFLPIMVANIEDIEKLGLKINEQTYKILNSHLVPGALTFVLEFENNQKPFWLEGREEVAIRIPNDYQLLEVLKITGPLFVTSANKHGVIGTYNNIEQLLPELNGKPDIIVDCGIKNEIPSTIINCRFNPPKIEREGGITNEIITKILENE